MPVSHVTYTFQSESTLHSCLNVKELLAWSMHEIWSLSDCNWAQTHIYLVHKQTLNHLAKLTSLAKWLSVHLWTKWMWVQVQLQSIKVTPPPPSLSAPIPTPISLSVALFCWLNGWLCHISCTILFNNIMGVQMLSLATQGFPYWGDGGSSPTSQKFAHSPTQSPGKISHQ